MANYATSVLAQGSNNYVYTLPYGECSTAAATAAKTVDAGTFALNKGARVLVKFTVTNTASKPTLNVSSTGPKYIKYRGSTISTSYLGANKIYEFVYDGTNWELIGDINTNTTALGSMSGTLSVSHGGTGQTTLRDAANALINGLDTGTSTPVDADYYISQYVGGGTTGTTFHRRPMSALWKYIQGKGVATKGLYTGTLTTAGWTANGTTGYKQTLAVTGVAASDTPAIGIVLTGTAATDQTLLDGWNLVSRITTAANKITAYCYGEKPTVALPLQILCVR